MSCQSLARAEWTQGNAVHLLENGEEFFPRFANAIANALEVVLLETFILLKTRWASRWPRRCAPAPRGA
jgi:cardiolipin synthase